MTEPLEMTDKQPVSRSLDLFGVLAVLCLAVLPDVYRAVLKESSGFEGSVSFHYMTTSLIVRSLQVSVPLLLIVKLSKIDWKSVGLCRVRWGIDSLAGIGLWLAGIIGFYIAFYIAYVVLPETVFPIEKPESVFEGPQTGFDYALLVAASCANGFAEEFVMRGYLLTRLERLLNSTWAALLITSFLFAAYHIYQGAAMAIGIMGAGLIFGGAFCLWRRLWPLVIAHALADFVGLLTV